ncbi:MAG: glycosyl transferase, partial [Bacteroidota bacterium]
MKTRKQKIILGLKITTVLLSLFLLLVFIFRDALLQQAIGTITKKLDRDYDCTFSVRKAAFEGFNGVSMEKVILVPHGKDTLFRIDHLKTSVSVWKFFTGTLRLQSLQMENGFVQLVKNENGRNFDAFLRKKDSTTSDEKPNYAKLAYRILNRGLNLIPTDMQLRNLSLRMNDMGKKATMRLNTLTLQNKHMESALLVQTNTFSQRWKINGFADPRNKHTDLRFFNIDTGKIKVPYFDERYGLQSSFDSIRLNVSNIDMDGGELHIDGFTSISNLTINHPKIANKDVIIKNARFDYNFLFGKNFVAIDSSSTAQLNQIKCHPYVSYNNETDKIYTLKVKIPKMKAQRFINSLPEG